MQFPTGDKLSSIFAFTLMPFAKFEKLDRYLQCNVGVVVKLCVKQRADFSNLAKGLRVNAISKPVFSAMDWPVRARGRGSSIEYRAHSRAFCKVRKTDRYLQRFVGVVVHSCVKQRADFSNFAKGIGVNAISNWRNAQLDYCVHSNAFCKVRNIRSLFTAFFDGMLNFCVK